MPGGLGALGQLAGPVDLPARADEAVAGKQLVAEPGHAGGLERQRVAVLVLRRLAVDGVEPQGHLGQLHRHRVQVHAEDVAVGEYMRTFCSSCG
jgi:hypothetical protein